MYLVGASHPHKITAQRMLEKLIRDRQRLTTDAEVLQEILRRYAAIDRRDDIQPAFDAPHLHRLRAAIQQRMRAPSDGENMASPGPGESLHYETLAWFDHWLEARDTGVL